MGITFLLLASGLLTQSAQEPPPVVLKSSTRLVQLSVLAKRHNRPVTGLTRSDFTVTDNGRVREIAMFSEESGPGTAAKALPKLPPNVFTNRFVDRAEQQPGRRSAVNILLLDVLNTSRIREAIARDQVLEYVKTMPPNDHLGIYLLSDRLHVIHDYTADARDAAEHLRAFRHDNSLHKLPIQGTIQIADRVRTTLNAVSEIADHLALLPGRKNLIWLSSGFPPVLCLTGPCPTTSFSGELIRCMAALNRANVSIYPIDAMGLTAPPTSEASRSGFGTVEKEWSPTQLRIMPSTRDTMLEMAEGTGGRAAFNVNDFARAIRDAVEDTESSYSLGYYADSNADGKFHKITVSVKQGGIELRHRRGYYDGEDVPRDAEARQAQLRNAATSPLDIAELGVTVKVEKAGGELDLIVQVDPAGITLAQQQSRWDGQLDIVFVQLDHDGGQYNGRTDTLDLKLTPERYKWVSAKGVGYHQRVTREPRASTLRVLVRDNASSALGSVTVPLDEN